MKCPRCGAEMTLDEHRKYDLYMCYECGYMEGRDLGELVTNFEHIKTLDVEALAEFIAEGLEVDADRVTAWLNEGVD